MIPDPKSVGQFRASSYRGLYFFTEFWKSRVGGEGGVKEEVGVDIPLDYLLTT